MLVQSKVESVLSDGQMSRSLYGYAGSNRQCIDRWEIAKGSEQLLEKAKCKGKTNSFAKHRIDFGH